MGVCSGIGVAYIVPHTGDLFIESCRCGYVVELVFIVPHASNLSIESCSCGYIDRPHAGGFSMSLLGVHM